MPTSVDWTHAWSASLIAAAKAFVITVVVSVVVVWLLVRFTSWGGQFWRITGRYFRPRRSWVSWRPLLTVLVMLWLALFGVQLVLLVSYLINDLFTALQKLDAATFWYSLAVFGVLATVAIVYAVVDALIISAFAIYWRIWLTDQVIGDWLNGLAFYRGQFVTKPVDNPDQRIEQDIANFIDKSQSLFIGAVTAINSLVVFTIVLWELSGPLHLLGYTVPRAMVFQAYLYITVASVVAFRIGRPLIRLNFLNEKLSASFRYALVRLRDHSESVAFYRGQEMERRTLTNRFASIITNQWAIVFRTLKFKGFNTTVTEISQVFPLLVQAPRFFSGAITLGVLQQTFLVFSQVSSNVSFFRNSYAEFAGYRATLTRLTGLLDANNQARALPTVAAVDRVDNLTIEGLTVRRPDGRPLIEDLSLQLSPGQALLVTGASGRGKTTLLRSLANLWPYAQGSVRRPADVLFLPQEPYVPLGSLRAAVTYPQPPHLTGDEEVREMLRMVQLGHLADRINDEVDWSHILSPGEQQRLGFARIMTNRPRLVCLDEATSALDQGTEHALYTLIRQHLPKCIRVSVGHRSTLTTFHTHYLELLGEGHWDATVPVGQ